MKTPWIKADQLISIIQDTVHGQCMSVAIIQVQAIIFYVKRYVARFSKIKSHNRLFPKYVIIIATTFCHFDWGHNHFRHMWLMAFDLTQKLISQVHPWKGKHLKSSRLQNWGFGYIAMELVGCLSWKQRATTCNGLCFRMSIYASGYLCNAYKHVVVIYKLWPCPIQAFVGYLQASMYQ